MLNNNIKIYGYIGSQNIIPGSTRDIECSINEDLYAHDDHGNRIRSLSFNQYLMDVDRSIWHNKIIKWANEQPGALSGVFLDVAQPYLHLANYTSTPANYDKSNHAGSMMSMFRHLRDSYSGDIIINGLRPGLSVPDYTDDITGGMVEGFIFSRPNQEINTQRTMNHINALLKASGKGLLATTATKGYKDETGKRVYAVACYLCGCSDGSSYCYLDIPTEFAQRLQYYPEYDIDLGLPLDMPKTIYDILDMETGIVKRQFRDGIVIVNATDISQQIELTSSYDEISVSGGGTFDDIGELRYQRIPAGMVTIHAGSAKILKKAGEPLTGIRLTGDITFGSTSIKDITFEGTMEEITINTGE